MIYFLPAFLQYKKRRNKESVKILLEKKLNRSLSTSYSGCYQQQKRAKRLRGFHHQMVKKQKMQAADRLCQQEQFLNFFHELNRFTRISLQDKFLPANWSEKAFSVSLWVFITRGIFIASSSIKFKCPVFNLPSRSLGVG